MNNFQADEEREQKGSIKNTVAHEYIRYLTVSLTVSAFSLLCVWECAHDDNYLMSCLVLWSDVT